MAVEIESAQLETLGKELNNLTKAKPVGSDGSEASLAQAEKIHSTIANLEKLDNTSAGNLRKIIKTAFDTAVDYCDSEDTFKAILKYTHIDDRIDRLYKITGNPSVNIDHIGDKSALIINSIQSEKPNELGKLLSENSETCRADIFPLLFDSVNNSNKPNDAINTALVTASESQPINTAYILKHFKPDEKAIFQAMQAAIKGKNLDTLQVLTNYAQTQEIGADFYKKIGDESKTLVEQVMSRPSNGYNQREMQKGMLRLLVAAGAEIPDKTTEDVGKNMREELIAAVQQYMHGFPDALNEEFKEIIKRNLDLLNRSKNNGVKSAILAAQHDAEPQESGKATETDWTQRGYRSGIPLGRDR